jgi:hypothetical protein
MADARFQQSPASDQVIEGLQMRDLCLVGGGEVFEIGYCAS